MLRSVNVEGAWDEYDHIARPPLVPRYSTISDYTKVPTHSSTAVTGWVPHLGGQYLGIYKTI